MPLCNTQVVSAKSSEEQNSRELLKGSAATGVAEPPYIRT
jgi:hypothetical protein